MCPRKIVDAKSDADGDIVSVRLQGNQSWTPIGAAVRMADRGQIDGAHAVHPKHGDPFLRSNPDGKKGNNLDEMARE